MWFFNSPKIIFGEDAIAYLEQISGQRAFIVTDENMEKLGFVRKVQAGLSSSGITSEVFAEVEAEPSTQTVERCAAAITAFEPDWVIGLGGGSCMDAAKAAWFRFERPDLPLEAINPIEQYGLRAKARLITIPTTAGSGSEVSQAVLIRDLEARRKLELGSYELIADLAIVDPQFSAGMPRQLTLDSGIDVLAHAIDVYNAQVSSDYTDALCLHAIRLVFTYLPRAVEHGAQDMEAREKMANAATLAGMAICNSNISMAHALSHSAGGLFSIPHGRLTAIFLPLTIEYNANGGVGRYLEIVKTLGLPAEDETQAAAALAAAVRALMRRFELPMSLQDAGISTETLETELDKLCDDAMMDLGYVVSLRMPGCEDLQRLFRYAWEGRAIDF
jgi:alcohol dehydrogenase class IV